MNKYAKLYKSIQKYYKLWKLMQNYATVWKKNAKVCKLMQIIKKNYATFWESMYV